MPYTINPFTGKLDYFQISSVTSVSNSDSTLTISPTTGNVVASLNLSHANTWVGQQTFSTSAPIFSTLTAGSIPFIGVSGVVSQDNSNLFWSTAHTQFLIGTNTYQPNGNIPLILSINGGINFFDGGTRTYNAGLVSELNGALVEFGVNDDRSNRFGGTYDSSVQGGFFRFDVRNGQPLLDIQGRQAGSTAITSSVAKVFADGGFWTGGLTAVNGGNNNTGRQLAVNGNTNTYIDWQNNGSDQMLIGYEGSSNNRMVLYDIVSGGVIRMAVKFATGNVGFGNSDPQAGVEVLRTTEQLRLSYDTSNHQSVTIDSSGNATYSLTGTTPKFTFAQEIIHSAPERWKGYTVATLPAGVQGDAAFVTDALAPTFLGVLTGGGTIVTPVFYNGTAWVAH